MRETALQLNCFMSEIVSAWPTLQDSAHPTNSILEFLPEGPGIPRDAGHKKRVPGGFLLVAATGSISQKGSPRGIRF